MKRFSRVGVPGAILALAVVTIAALSGGRSQPGTAASEAVTAAPMAATAATTVGVTVSSGEYFSCAATTSGPVRCWGFNTWGQLGNGEVQESEQLGTDSPVAVLGLPSGVRAVAAGGVHACALSAAGGLWCWGGNGAGQLGDGSTTNRSAPVAVIGLDSGVQAVSAGSDHTCAVTAAGGVTCWGYNAWGQLGDGTTTNRATPVEVVGLDSGVVAVTAGGTHSCALTSGGALSCWGSNSAGRLGDGTFTDRPQPVDVIGLGSGVAQVSAGHAHVCALTTAGGVLCWGSNTVGQLGDGTTTDRAIPGGVIDLATGVAALDAGGGHTCALNADGRLTCWGANSGQLGDGSDIARLAPVDVVDLPAAIEAVSAGYEHTCAVTRADGLLCWGFNLHGELGDAGNTYVVGPGSSDLHFESHLTPVPVHGYE